MSDVRDPKTDQSLPITTNQSECVFTEALSLVRGQSLAEDEFLAKALDLLRAAVAASGEDIVCLLQQRQALGVEKYGTSLHTFNGRDVNKDILEEAADLFVYAVQRSMESAKNRGV